MRWALGRLERGTSCPDERRALAIGLAIVAALFGLRRLTPLPRVPAFAAPVTVVYGRQVNFTINALSGAKTLAPSPSFDSNLSAVSGADVLLLFVESYGAVTYERPEFAARLDAPRRALDAAIHASGLDVVSAYVESPTFGGSSWFAHISLLSGIEVRDPDANALLMTERRPTLPTAFAAHGYRTSR